MWRGKELLCLSVLLVQISTQPISDVKEDVRQVRQLDFTECCPCPRTTEDYHGLEDDEFAPSIQRPRFRSRDLDDCPCRAGHGDAEGAPSILFPTAMRAAGTVLSPIDKKEEVKPLLHPEVDLASSVLQTLREATDEELQDAVARDAARSMAKAAEEIVFGDAAPQESNSNIVTIVMTPKHADNVDDAIPEASYMQESRCIPPTEQMRHDTANMRASAKPTSLLHGILKLPTAQSLLDMDNNVGASDIQETIVQADKKLGLGLRNLFPNLQNLEGKETKFPELRSSSIQDKLKEFISNRSSLLEDLRNKTASNILLAPKTKLDSFLSKSRESRINLSKTNQDQSADNSLLIPNKSPLNLLEDSKLADLKNLWKLRDVELVPLKDIIKGKTNIPKASLKPLFDRSSKMISHIDDSTETQKETLNDIGNDEPNVSPTIININIINPKDEAVSSNCDQDNTQSSSVQKDDLNSSPSDKQLAVADNDTEPSQVEEVTKKDDVNISEENIEPKDEENIDSKEAEQIRTEETLSPDATDDMDSKCIEKSAEEEDTITNPSNNIDNVISIMEIPETTEANLERDESCDSDKDVEDNNARNAEENIKPQVIKTPLSIEKTLSDIKENLIKRIENLKDATGNIFNKNINNQKLEEESSLRIDSDQDCDNENVTSPEQDLLNHKTREGDGTVENISPIKRDGSSIELNNENTSSENVQSDPLQTSASDNVSVEKEINMDDLQNMSDSMLKKENFENDSKCSENVNSLVTEPINVASKKHDDQFDPEPSASSQDIARGLENWSDTANGSNLQSKNTCNDAFLDNSRSTKSNDLNTEGNNLIAECISQNKNLIGSIKSNQVVQPKSIDVHNILRTIPPIGALKPSDGRAKTAAKLSSKVSLPSMESNPTMMSAASTSSFRSQLPPNRLLEDINLDVLGLKPHTLKLPSLGELSLKPITLHSAFRKSNEILQPKDIEDAHPLATTHDIDEIKARIKSNADKIFKNPLRATDLNLNSLLPRTGSVDLLENMNSQAKDILRNAQRTIESRLGTPTNSLLKSSIKKPNELFDILARNHEDVNDKLKALHIDFNDRIETMRNSLFVSEPKYNPRTQSGYRNSHKNRISSSAAKPLAESRQSQKKFSSRRINKKPPVELSPKFTDKKRFNMPGAASVPVPSTVKIPELKMASSRIPAFSLQKVNIPKSRHTVTSFDTESFTTKKPTIRKQFNPFKDSKIKVSFSTTPRSTLRIKSPYEISSIQKTTGKLSLDQKNSSTEQNSKISISDVSGSKRTSINVGKLSVPKSKDREDVASTRHTKTLQSWPRATESAFLSKVRDAVKARLTKVNSSGNLTTSGKNKPLSSQKHKMATGNVETDMARSASENVNVMDGEPMKEKVSYKCSMVCTKH